MQSKNNDRSPTPTVIQSMTTTALHTNRHPEHDNDREGIVNAKDLQPHELYSSIVTYNSKQTAASESDPVLDPNTPDCRSFAPRSALPFALDDRRKGG